MRAQRAQLEAMAVQLQRARFPEEVFGLPRGDVSRELKNTFRRLMRECHPNVHEAVDRPLAEVVTERLLHFNLEANLRLQAGIYGATHLPTPSSSRMPAPSYETSGFIPVRFSVGRRTVTLVEPMKSGLICDLYRAEYGDDPEVQPFVKVACSASDNGLLEREFNVLQELWRPEPDAEFGGFAARQCRYVPRPLLTFLIDNGDGLKRRANVLGVPPARAFTVAELRDWKFPQGVAPAHAYWIFRRLLLTLWLAHAKGFVHGAVTPDHVLVFPEEHGLVLLDWMGAARRGREKVSLADAAYEDFLPPELLARAVAQPTMDIFMAAATTLYLLGGEARSKQLPPAIPQPIAAELLRCLAPEARYRPQDAFELHEAFGRALGRREYAPMTVP